MFSDWHKHSDGESDWSLTIHIDIFYGIPEVGAASTDSTAADGAGLPGLEARYFWREREKEKEKNINYYDFISCNKAGRENSNIQLSVTWKMMNFERGRWNNKCWRLSQPEKTSNPDELLAGNGRGH